MDTREEQLYKEYLTRPLVDGVVYIIAPDEIVVKTSHTSFANIRRPRGVELTDIQAAIKKLKRLKKAHPNVKVKGLAKCEKRIAELWDEYVEAVKLAKKQFVEVLGGIISSDSEQYFKALAPVIEDGFVELRDQEGNRWRWVFKSGVMSVVMLKEVGISTKHVGDNLMIVTENIDGEKYAIFSDRITALLEDWNDECEFVPDNDAKVYFASYNEKIINPYSYSDFESLIKLLKEKYSL